MCVLLRTVAHREMSSHLRLDNTLTQYRKWKGKHVGNGGVQSTCTFGWESFSQNDYVAQIACDSIAVFKRSHQCGINNMAVAKCSRLQ